MIYTDFHTHLDGYNTWELEEQLSDFKGILVSSSMDAESYKRNLEICDSVKKISDDVKIIPTFGIHPAKVKQVLEQSDDLSIFDSLCNSSAIIGEIGMDFCWYKEATAEQQEYVFRYFLNHCNEQKKFCVIHTKDAENLVAQILKDYPDAKPIIHWYDGPADIFKELVDRDYYFTFGCETSRSSHIQSLLKITPKNRILAETDNPESEVWLGGTDSSVNLIKRVYSDIGKVLCMNDLEVAEMINKNVFDVVG